ncbi:hypothetical protein HELRODRAFT_93842 [Helobdella robusta]|uniref:procollagen-proline 4-dioxygenase n=1 Tax=Helobdella robusta TaxID=6412 RepID=T1G8X9_HELRO|nr:hypothetical protein HELRODRAFT_93842 [Helobdella robusta]ESO05903.1 hypothetical protein HELRODRAFT_93842 [Helobdella robusta]
MYAAISEMEKILKVENEVARDLREYVQNEEGRLELLKGLADEFEEHSRKALANPEGHLSNPLNAYLLIKRFTSEWQYVLEEKIKKSFADDFLRRLDEKTANFPTSEDLHGAINALMRLQDVYDLSTSELADNGIDGTPGASKLSFEDCKLLGLSAYEKKDFYHTILWMTEAMRQLIKSPLEEPKFQIQRIDILDYLAFSYYQQGNIKKAINLTLDYLQLDPSNTRIQSNLRHYQQLLEQHRDLLSSSSSSGGPVADYDDDYNPRPHTDNRIRSDEFYNYERLCRGEKIMPIENEHLLTCQLKSHHPALYLRPAKEEQVNYDPPMFMYHDLLVDDQMETIKRLGRPRLYRSVVFQKEGMESPDFTAQDYRISKTGWISDKEHPHVLGFSTIASAIANLTLDYAEELQVLNYGIGGHYEPHFDYSSNPEPSEFEKVRGNRIATFLCYMSDIKIGGSTVFPQVGVKFTPKKGSCALWYNLHKSGVGDRLTSHAACPVLSGIKWATNKWFRERGQEFIRPCTLSPMD